MSLAVFRIMEYDKIATERMNQDSFIYLHSLCVLSASKQSNAQKSNANHHISRCLSTQSLSSF